MRKKMLWKSKVKLLIVLIAVAVFLLFLPLRSRDNFISRGILSLTSGGNQLVSGVIEGINNIWEDYIYLLDTKRDNDRLRKELSRLQGQTIQLVELNLENTRLRQLLGFKSKASFTTLPAQVVSRDPSNWFKTVLINKGKVSEVKRKATVVTHAGLVGHVVELSDKAAKVLLITDHSSRVAVLIQRTRAEGVLAGEGGETCHIEYLSRLADVKVGDAVISSGLGGIFPKGLKVGEVVAVERKDYGLFQQVEVAPSADLSRLEEVLVFKSVKEDVLIPEGKE